jgi:integrase/recombinase XerD
MSVAARVRMTGPLTPHAEGFAAELAAHGYTDLSAANQLRLMADLSRWLEATAIPLDRIDHDAVARFLAKRHRTHTLFTTERAVAPLLRHLGAARVIGPIDAPDRRPSSKLLLEYERYLVEERAVSSAHQRWCLAVAEQFLEGKRVQALTAKHVTCFVDARAERPTFVRELSALRSFLRFLFISSKTRLDLVHAVPRSPHWRLASLPKALASSELDAVFATCDRRTLVGARDYAILVLLGRLGLRAGEVAALRIDDLDWKAGELVIHGKGRVISRLPIPVDVGAAVVGYLRRSLRSKATRSVFVNSRAPYGALTSGAIVRIAGTALRAAGIEHGGAHRLRHTAATQMLRRGASLTEIAQVLRHRHIDTTAIYAKVDRDSLRVLARAWPVDGPDRDALGSLAQVWPGGVA